MPAEGESQSLGNQTSSQGFQHTNPYTQGTPMGHSHPTQLRLLSCHWGTPWTSSAKKKSCLCDLSKKRHRVFSSVASMASVVPLCRLCGKKALCTFLNEISLFFH